MSTRLSYDKHQGNIQYLIKFGLIVAWTAVGTPNLEI
jgi:hypothetical protein